MVSFKLGSVAFSITQEGGWLTIISLFPCHCLSQENKVFNSKVLLQPSSETKHQTIMKAFKESLLGNYFFPFLLL